MDTEQIYSTELLLYPMFYRKFVLRRMPDFSKLRDMSDLNEMPRQCVLHLINDNFLMNKPIVFVPEANNVFVLKDPPKKFIHHITQPVNGVLAYAENPYLPAKGLIATLMNYRRNTMRYIKPWEDIHKLPGNINTQAMICYNSLYRARFVGLMKDVRRFNYIMTTVINVISSLPNFKHIIPIPVGSNIYPREKYIPSFKAYTRTTIKAPTDPWYLFCMNLLGCIHTNTPSLFLNIPEAVRKNTMFLLYTHSHFVVLKLDELMAFNKGTTDTVLVKTVKLLNRLAEEGQELSYTDFGVTEPVVTESIDITGLTEADINKEEDEEETTVTPITHNAMPSITPREKLEGKITNQEVVERPKAELKDSTGKNLQMAKRLKATSQARYHEQFVGRYKRILTENHALDIFKGEQISRDKFLAIAGQAIKDLEEKKTTTPTPELKKVEQPVVQQARKQQPVKVTPAPTKTEETKEQEETDDIIENIPEIKDEIQEECTTIQPRLVNNGTYMTNAPAYVQGADKKEQAKFDAQTTEDIDSKAFAVIEQHTELTQAQYNRAIKIAQAYHNITVNYQGKDITVHELLNTSPQDTVSTSSLSFLKGQVPDESMLKSSVANFDQEYIDKFFLRDLVMELTAFNKVGMFLKDLKITDISDSMNNTYEIRAKYEDINHKEHTIRFTIPKVDERGYCYINGGLKVMKKQRISLPICKVSPTRVTLTSDYGKYLVERVTTVAHSFINYVDKLIEASNKLITIQFGSAKLQQFIYPYEFTAIGKKYISMIVSDSTNQNDKWYFFFDDSSKLVEYFTNQGFTKEQIHDAVETANDIKGYLVGMNKKDDLTFVYMKLDGSIAIYNSGSGVTQQGSTFIDLLCELCGISINHLSEWSEFKLLSKKIPTIFALCYRYGLSYMLNYTKCKYAIYERRGAYPKRQSDVVIKFKDKILVIPRAPLCFSLLFAGLNNYDLSKIEMDEMDSKDVYYDLLYSKKMSVHNLKGIDNFFDLFVDPITRDVLFRMGEPTEAKDLLIRATTLLTTEDCPPVAASTNHRFRSYERINTAIYRTLSNLYSSYRYKSIGSSNSFSVKDFEIANMIVNDQLMENVDQINPINDIKYREEYGHGGTGGRQSTDTFMIDDRQWPSDGVGILGEASVDNGKTGYAGNMSSNPSIDNVRGLTVSKKVSELEPSEILTCTSLLGPCVIQDDSKRISFLNIHMSHYVPTVEMSIPRVRTGYERVVAHRCKLPFAYVAEDNGVIESIDKDAHILTVYYPKKQKRVAVEYGDLYTNNGGGGFWCTQNIVINGFEQGDNVKLGDVILYNNKFFCADPTNKQVDLMFGTLANVALIDNSTTVEDSDIVSAEFAKRLAFEPVHPRDIVITKKTNIHKFAEIGTLVSNTDPLMIFDQSELTDDMFGKIDEETAVLLGDVNRQTPKAKFTGKIVKLDAFYIGSTADMSESARKLVDHINYIKTLKYKAAKGTTTGKNFYPTTKIDQSTRIGKIVLEEDTLIIRFYIQQQASMSGGDKIEFDSSLKSVCSGTDPEGWITEDNSVKCDALFSTVGICKRLINSPLLTGIANRCLEKVESDILDMYFK